MHFKYNISTIGKNYHSSKIIYIFEIIKYFVSILFKCDFTFSRILNWLYFTFGII